MLAISPFSSFISGCAVSKHLNLFLELFRLFENVVQTTSEKLRQGKLAIAHVDIDRMGYTGYVGVRAVTNIYKIYDMCSATVL